ncbi:MAG: carboxymuconolactone decarboxylase family protein [Candidatus Lustribacter sp.]
MPRLPALDPAAFTPEQQRVYAEIAAAHTGNVRGPWAIGLRVPEVADYSHKLYERLARDSKLGQRLYELIVLVVARHWKAQFAWQTHEKNALTAGVAQAAIDAIRERRTPEFDFEDERIAYDVVTELSTSRQLSDASYERAQAFFGDELLVELISVAGLYTMIAMLLNAFDAPIPAGTRRLE